MVLNKKSCPVPFEQQPLEEYNSLILSSFFSLPAKQDTLYLGFLVFCLSTFNILICLLFFSIDIIKYNDFQSIIEISLTIDIVFLLYIVQLYFSWAYVSKRLLSSTVFYEESGWYDGQIWVKTADVLMHDRLIAMNVSIPLMKKIKLSIFLFGFKSLAELVIRSCIF
nr:Ycf36 [Erythrocladia irregularis]